MTRVWEYAKATGGELLVLLALADFSNDAGESWPSIPVLAHKARLTERQVRRVLDKLEQGNEIRRQRSNGGRNRRNHYFITVLENPDKFTGTKLQGKNNSVIHDPETLTSATQNPDTGARRIKPSVNHHKEPPKGELPDWLDSALWEDFRAHRKSLKAKLTGKAEELALRKLGELRESGHDVRQVIEQSIERGWKGLFPIDARDSGALERAVERAFDDAD